MKFEQKMMYNDTKLILALLISTLLLTPFPNTKILIVHIACLLWLGICVIGKRHQSNQPSKTFDVVSQMLLSYIAIDGFIINYNFSLSTQKLIALFIFYAGIIAILVIRLNVQIILNLINSNLINLIININLLQMQLPCEKLDIEQLTGLFLKYKSIFSLGIQCDSKHTSPNLQRIISWLENIEIRLVDTNYI